MRDCIAIARDSASFISSGTISNNRSVIDCTLGPVPAESKKLSRRHDNNSTLGDPTISQIHRAAQVKSINCDRGRSNARINSCWESHRRPRLKRREEWTGGAHVNFPPKNPKWSRGGVMRVRGAESLKPVSRKAHVRPFAPARRPRVLQVLGVRGTRAAECVASRDWFARGNDFISAQYAAPCYPSSSPFRSPLPLSPPSLLGQLHSRHFRRSRPSGSRDSANPKLADSFSLF